MVAKRVNIVVVDPLFLSIYTVHLRHQSTSTLLPCDIESSIDASFYLP